MKKLIVENNPRPSVRVEKPRKICLKIFWGFASRLRSKVKMAPPLSLLSLSCW
jgi:hypothetical protein